MTKILGQIGTMETVQRRKLRDPAETQQAAPTEGVLRDLLRARGLKAVRIGHVISADSLIHEHVMKVKGPMPIDVDALVADLRGRDGLAGFSVLPRDE